jgi:pyrimidine-nucleoside phosphorylase
MRTVDILRRKREGRELDAREIEHIVRGAVDDSIPDYQLAAFLMAVCLRGMTEDETLALTRAMLETGDVLDLSDVEGPKVDKHSTGGVGDKVTLVAAPLAASLGVRVPMLSGRGLGHSGGTLDKLESIPGFQVELEPDRFKTIVRRVGLAICGTTKAVAPADRKLYALRDATDTVESLPLITGSILSKKLAEGIDGLVLDVKSGSGAFMKTGETARELARLLLGTLARMGRKAKALITDMSQPLGNAVGNALEVEESVRALAGGGPADLVELSNRIAAEMLLMGGLEDDLPRALTRVEDERLSGRGLEKLLEVVEAQGGDRRALEKLPFCRAQETSEVLAGASGFVSEIDTEAIGLAAAVLGAGRERKEDAVDPAAGIVVHAKLGSELEPDERLVTLHFNDEARARAPEAERLVRSAYVLSETPPSADELPALIHGSL